LRYPSNSHNFEFVMCSSHTTGLKKMDKHPRAKDTGIFWVYP